MRLQDSMTEIDDGDLDNEVSSVLRRLLAPYALTYDEVEGDDLDWLEEAAGLLLASRLCTPLSTGGANGDLTGEKSDTISRTFSSPRFGEGEKDRWEKEAYQALARCSFAIAMNLLPNAFAKGGRRRNINLRCDIPEDCGC